MELTRPNSSVKQLIASWDQQVKQVLIHFLLHFIPAQQHLGFRLQFHVTNLRLFSFIQQMICSWIKCETFLQQTNSCVWLCLLLVLPPGPSAGCGQAAVLPQRVECSARPPDLPGAPVKIQQDDILETGCCLGPSACLSLSVAMVTTEKSDAQTAICFA